MSQEKAQLIAPQGHFTVPGLNVAGVVTASSFSGNCTGTASSLAQGSNLVVGVMTASSFAGDVAGNAAGLSTTTAGLKLGIVTATSFAGNFTGIGSGLTGTPNIVAGLVTASQFIGNTPGLAAGLSAGKNLNAGIITATTFHGDGSNLTGAGSTAFIKQDVTAQSGTTTIDLNDGNIIYLTHSNNTTIAFSNVSTAEDITIIRTLTANTITWPAAVKWNGGSAPTLLGANPRSTAGQVFNLVTYNAGTNWYGWEEVASDPSTFALYSWGSGDDGILAQNSLTKYSSPTQVPGTTWSTLTGGFSFDSRGAIKNDGTLWMWGKNDQGQLGQNDRVSDSSPVQIPGTTWSNVSAGGDQGRCALAIKTDGTLWSWGGNHVGNLGLNEAGGPSETGNPGNQYSSPVQIPGTTWKDVSNGADYVLATKTDGTAWAWGENGAGQLGLTNKTDRSSPTQIPGTTWSYMVAGNPFNSMGVKTDGTFWTWGLGNNGALGQNNLTGYSSPKQVPGTTWSNTHPTKLSAGFYRGFAIKTDGTLWAWGYQGNGELAQNDTIRYSSPVQIPGTTWESVDNMYNVTLATKTDGTLWSWGFNNNGELGHNNRIKYSSPVQIPGNWKTGSGTDTGRTIAAGSDNSLALKVQ